MHIRSSLWRRPPGLLPSAQRRSTSRRRRDRIGQDDRAAAALPGWAAGEHGDLAALTCRRTPAASAPWRCHPIHDQRAYRDPMPLQPLDQPNGLERRGPDGDLLEVIMRRYERASTLLMSNRPVDDWGKLLGDTAAVTALLDRLLHHAHVLKCGPRSWRTKVHTDLRPEEATK
jgi:hypothetical protein